jgi:hypothetical protein
MKKLMRAAGCGLAVCMAASCLSLPPATGKQVRKAEGTTGKSLKATGTSASGGSHSLKAGSR